MNCYCSLKSVNAFQGSPGNLSSAVEQNLQKQYDRENHGKFLIRQV